jgi:hypothetical protein
MAVSDEQFKWLIDINIELLSYLAECDTTENDEGHRHGTFDEVDKGRFSDLNQELEQLKNS